MQRQRCGIGRHYIDLAYQLRLSCRTRLMDKFVIRLRGTTAPTCVRGNDDATDVHEPCKAIAIQAKFVVVYGASYPVSA